MASELSWAMSCSILVGIHQAISKAREEHAAILAANPGKAFVADAARVAHTIEALIDAKKSLDYDLRNIARGGNLSIPEVST